nr:putative peptidoglycan-binding domain-containing protein [Mesorhizobium sp. B264B1A]
MAGAELPDGVDYAVFDFAVNSGPSRAAKYLQAVVGTAQDGRIGPETLAAVGSRPAAVVIDNLCDARLAFLKRLSTWGTFGKGWQSRVASVRANALKMSAQPVAAPPAPVKPVPSQQTPAPASAAPVPPAAVQPGTGPASEPPKAGNRLIASIIAALALTAMAAAGAWHHVTMFVSNLF